MADKEANIYIVDVGASTAECHNGRMESDLEYGMKYVWEKIGLALQANRKGLGLGVIALRHDETKVDLEDVEGYENIGWLPRRNWSGLCPFALGLCYHLSNFLVSCPPIGHLQC